MQDYGEAGYGEDYERDEIVNGEVCKVVCAKEIEWEFIETSIR